MNKIILYSLPTCPKCNVLKKKLAEANIAFEIVDDAQAVLDFLKANEMSSEVPVLHIEGFKPMNFTQAWGWVSRQEGENG